MVLYMERYSKSMWRETYNTTQNNFCLTRSFPCPVTGKCVDCNFRLRGELLLDSLLLYSPGRHLHFSFVQNQLCKHQACSCHCLVELLLLESLSTLAQFYMCVWTRLPSLSNASTQRLVLSQVPITTFLLTQPYFLLYHTVSNMTLRRLEHAIKVTPSPPLVFLIFISFPSAVFCIYGIHNLEWLFSHCTGHTE